MKALFAIAVLVLAHSSLQAQYGHVRDYQKTNLITSLDPGVMKRNRAGYPVSSEERKREN